MTPIATNSTASVPNDVTQYAKAVGAESYLTAIRDLARRSFGGGPPVLFVEEDAEIPDYRHIVVEVETAGLGPDELLAAQSAWSVGLFQVCPADLARHFVLGWR